MWENSRHSLENPSSTFVIKRVIQTRDLEHNDIPEHYRMAHLYPRCQRGFKQKDERERVRPRLHTRLNVQ